MSTKPGLYLLFLPLFPSCHSFTPDRGRRAFWKNSFLFFSLRMILFELSVNTAGMGAQERGCSSPSVSSPGEQSWSGTQNLPWARPALLALAAIHLSDLPPLLMVLRFSVGEENAASLQIVSPYKRFGEFPSLVSYHFWQWGFRGFQAPGVEGHGLQCGQPETHTGRGLQKKDPICYDGE